MVKPMIAVCSARAPARTQNSHSKGHQWWARDVYHLRSEVDTTRTRCGRDCSEWLVIGPLDELDSNCCERCSAHAAADLQDALRNESYREGLGDPIAKIERDNIRIAAEQVVVRRIAGGRR